MLEFYAGFRMTSLNQAVVVVGVPQAAKDILIERRLLATFPSTCYHVNNFYKHTLPTDLLYLQTAS